MNADAIVAALAGLVESLGYEIGRRSGAEWIFVFAPLLVFLEVPRYYLPQVGLIVLRWLGRDGADERRREAYLRRPPRVSVIVAGRNEGATIEMAIRSSAFLKGFLDISDSLESPVPFKPTTIPNPVSWLSRIPLIAARSLTRTACKVPDSRQKTVIPSIIFDM